MDKRTQRSTYSAHQALTQAAKRTPAQQEAALKAAMERAELIRRLGA
jgi:hypothetical protein